MDERKSEFIRFHVEEFMRERGLFKEGSPDWHNIGMDDLIEMANMFLDYVWVKDMSFLGVNGWLLWKDSCLLQDFFEESKKHEGKMVSDVPELARLYKSIEEFEGFSKMYLGFGRNDENKFVEL